MEVPLERVPRSFSFSSISGTTVNSSEVNSAINRYVNGNVATSGNNFAAENFVRDLNTASQANFRIEGSSGIRVGDDIYNIYNYVQPPTLEGKFT